MSTMPFKGYYYQSEHAEIERNPAYVLSNIVPKN